MFFCVDIILSALVRISGYRLICGVISFIALFMFFAFIGKWTFYLKYTEDDLHEILMNPDFWKFDHFWFECGLVGIFISLFSTFLIVWLVKCAFLLFEESRKPSPPPEEEETPLPSDDFITIIINHLQEYQRLKKEKD